MPHPVAWESRFVGQGTTEEVSVHVKISAMIARLCLSYIAIDIAPLPMRQGMWLRMSPVTLPFHVKPPIVDRHSTYLRGLTVAASSKFR